MTDLSQDQKKLLMAELAIAQSAIGFATVETGSGELASLAEQVLADPIALRKLGDRVFDLMRLDLSRQRERSRGYRS